MKIYQILDKIDDNQLFVPAFQREYVWKRDDAKKLFDSLIKYYPTGTLLTWETNNPPELKGAWKYKSEQGAVKLVLDGQQRITTLYMILRGEIPPYYTAEEIKQDTRNLYVNVKTLELSYHKKTIMENDPCWVNLTQIFKKNIKPKHITKALMEKGQEVSDELDDLIDDNFNAITCIPDREFVEQEVPIKATLKEAIDIFYIVNSSGVNLTDAELALAQISGYWPKARKQFKAKLQIMEKEGFVFNLDFIVYVLLGILHQSGSEMQKLHTPDNLDSIQSAWERLEKYTLDYVMNIMKTHAFIDHTKEINSVYALVPILVYTYHKGTKHLSQIEIKKIIKWFYYSQIRFRYISQMPQKLDKDVTIVSSEEEPFDRLLSIIKAERPLEISKDEFVGVDIRHPLYGLMRWYFKSRKAICFTTGVGLQKNMGKSYSLEWDHIFPYSVLKNMGYGINNRLKYSLAQEVTNRAILTQVANRSKSTKLPEDYLAEVEKKFPQALKLQSIPEDRELWKLENYEKFLEERRRILSEELNAFLNGITESLETFVETPLEEIIAEGESSDLEFKASFRWSYQEGCVNKKLEDVVVKSIAAFSNGEGGTLLIGVSDEGEILGLEHDYASMEGSKDDFELRLRELLKKNFGVTFATNNLSVTFPQIEEKEICQINIKKGIEPKYLEVKDKNGVKAEKFYVRSGNSSTEIPLSELSKYINSRFPKMND